LIPPATNFDDAAVDYAIQLQQGLQLTGENPDFFARARVRWMAVRLGIRLPDRQPREPLPRSIPAASIPAAALPLEPRIVDFGCGIGTALPILDECFQPSSLVGVDTSKKSIEIAKSRFVDVPKISLDTLADYRPLEDFHLAYCNGVFHHIQPVERAEAYGWIHRALKKQGVLCLWENNPWNPGTRLVMRGIPFDRDAIMLSAREAKRDLVQAGFRVIKIDYCFYFPRPLAWLRSLEPFLHRLPLGGQYCVIAEKR